MITGKALKLGDNVNTDLIIPGKYLVSIDPVELAKHAFEPLGDEWPDKLKAHDVLVAGSNFGCGSAREQAASCLRGAGIKAVVAKSFARVFYRNAINEGIPALEVADLPDDVADEDLITIDAAAGIVEAKGKKYSFPPFPASLQQILDAGGLVPYLQSALGDGLGVTAHEASPGPAAKER
ncbi:MAG: 3-isopropylmalate dehydratase [Chloroflexota bacterium]|nr:3-isopropylmalate dehydratase [Chloroflexota bacterium]